MAQMRGSRENIETPATVRIGKVSSIDVRRHRVRVEFLDKSSLVSYWLGVIVPNTLLNKDEMYPDIGENVVCLMLGNGLEMGFVLGSYYDNKNTPPYWNRNLRVHTFKDGTRIMVDREKHIVEAQDSFGSMIRMSGGNIYLQASEVGAVYANNLKQGSFSFDFPPPQPGG